jgi:hypothetical protein
MIETLHLMILTHIELFQQSLFFPD